MAMMAEEKLQPSGMHAIIYIGHAFDLCTFVIMKSGSMGGRAVNGRLEVKLG